MRACCAPTIRACSTTPTCARRSAATTSPSSACGRRDIFAPATLTKIARVTDQLAAINGVERVLSLTNTVDPAADVFNPPPLLPNIPPSAADIAALKAKLAATPLYAQNLVAPDGNGAAINVVFRPMTDARVRRSAHRRAIAAILADARRAGAVRLHRRRRASPQRRAR